MNNFQSEDMIVAGLADILNLNKPLSSTVAFTHKNQINNLSNNSTL